MKMPEQNHTTDTMKEGQHELNNLPVPQEDSNGAMRFVPTWMRPDFRRVLFTAIPKAEQVSRLAATWIDTQPLIGGGLLVWAYNEVNDDIEPIMID